MELTIFWDIENIRPPPYLNGKEIVQRIEGHIRNIYPTVKIKDVFAIGSMDKILQKTRRDLQNGGITMLDCACTKPGASDIAIISEILKLTYYNKPPYMICLISGDRDFGRVIHFLDSVGYTIIVIHQTGSSNELVYAGLTTFEWQSVMFGSEFSMKNSYSKGISSLAFKKESRSIATQTFSTPKPQETPLTASTFYEIAARIADEETKTSLIDSFDNSSKQEEREEQEDKVVYLSKESSISKWTPSSSPKLLYLKEKSSHENLNVVKASNEISKVLPNIESSKKDERRASHQTIDISQRLRPLRPIFHMCVALIPNDHYLWFLHHFNHGKYILNNSQCWKDIGYSSYERCLVDCERAGLISKVTTEDSIDPVSQIMVVDEYYLTSLGKALLECTSITQSSSNHNGNANLSPSLSIQRPTKNRYHLVCRVDVRFRMLVNSFMDAIEDYSEQFFNEFQKKVVLESTEIPYDEVVMAIQGRAHHLELSFIEMYISLAIEESVIEVCSSSDSFDIIQKMSSKKKSKLRLNDDIKKEWNAIRVHLNL